MVICQETSSHGKKIYGNLTAARHAPSKKVQITRYYVIWMCAFLSVKKNYGKIGPRRAAVVCWPMTNLFSISIISIILSTTINLGVIIVDECWWVYLQLSAANGGTEPPPWRSWRGWKSRMVKGSLIYINRGDTHNLALENPFLKLESVGSSQSCFVCLSFGGDFKCLELILVTLVFEAASIGMTNWSRYRQQTMMTQTHKHKHRYAMIIYIYNDYIYNDYIYIMIIYIMSIYIYNDYIYI